MTASVRKSALFLLGLVVTTLVALGLVVLSSAGEANGVKLYNDAYHFLKYQGAFVVVSIFAAALVALFDYRHLRNYPWLSWLILVVTFALLIAVFGFESTKGSHRWIRFHGLRFQPGELAKLVTVLIVAVWVDRIGWRVELFWRGTFCPFMLIGALAVPVLCEPDFGSVMVIGLAGSLVMLGAGSRLRHMLPFFFGGIAIVAGLVMMNPNRMARLFNDDKLYQVNMALAAIGNGGIWGVGLGESMQKQFYLPEAHTDFILAVGAEELGLFFSIAVIFLFLAFFALAVHIAYKATDRFGRLLVMGMAFIIFFQAMFNIGVVCHALPTKGVALPFFSYGGTNMLMSFLAVGVIMSVGIHSCRDAKHAVLRKVLTRSPGRNG